MLHAALFAAVAGTLVAAFLSALLLVRRA